MPVGVRDLSLTAEISITQWLHVAARIALWSAVFLLVLYPLLMVLASAFSPGTPNDQPLNIADLLTERLLTASINTLRLGLCVSFLSLLMGACAALLAMQSRGGPWIDVLMSIPFLTPPFLVSLAWSLAVGPKGYLALLGLPGRTLENGVFSFGGMSLLMAFHYAPMVYFAARAQMPKIPVSLLWAGQIAGARSGRILFRILVPMLAPALLAGGFLAFAAGIEEYGTPLIIGNRIGFPVISTEIARLVSVYPINLTLASALASLLLAFAAAMYFASYYLQRTPTSSTKPSAHPIPNLLVAWARGGLWFFVLVYAMLAVAIPLGSMCLTSLIKLVSAGPAWNNLTAQHYVQALADDSNGLRNALSASFALALLAALLGTLVGTGCVREGKTLSSLALIPVAVPAITMAVGFIRGWNAPWIAWLPLYGTTLIVGLFYTAQYLPYAVQYARAGLSAIPPSYEWAARVHGGSPARTMARIIAPLLWPHSLAGAILIFSISFRELVGSVLLRPPGVQTVATFILREFDQGSPATGMALGVIAIAVSMLSVSLARYLAPRKP